LVSIVEKFATRTVYLSREKKEECDREIVKGILTEYELIVNSYEQPIERQARRFKAKKR